MRLAKRISVVEGDITRQQEVIEKVIFVCFGPEAYDGYSRAVTEIVAQSR
jgi:O-acetyl-ADP-ribose deacetylase (regulator of RNase III)